MLTIVVMEITSWQLSSDLAAATDQLYHRKGHTEKLMKDFLNPERQRYAFYCLQSKMVIHLTAGNNIRTGMKTNDPMFTLLVR